MKTTGGKEDGLLLVPFRGVRYTAVLVDGLGSVTSPPYDVVVRPDGLDALESADPYNIVRLILPRSSGRDTAEEHNRQAARTLDRWLADGILAADPEPALYVYEQSRGDLLQRGVIGALALSEPAEGVVLPHEDVMREVVDERAGLMRTTAANLEPLLLTYRSEGTAADSGPAAVVERTVRGKPLLTAVTEDGFRHRLWSVTDPAEQAEITAGLARHQALIADGHHRWATYLRLRAEHGAAGAWGYGLVLLVDTAHYPLQVRAIHRVLHSFPVDRALAALRESSFRVRTVEGGRERALSALADATTGGNAFLLAGDGRYHLVDGPDPALLARTVPTDRPPAWRSLDATVLHHTLIAHVWGIPDTAEHIAYIHDTAAAVAKAENEGSTAVLLHPVREEVVRDLARLGVTMPRKSTSFGPKPATGLVLRSLRID